MTSTAGTCLLAVRQTSFRRHELYPGSIMELGNLDSDGRLSEATAKGFAGSQREMHNRNNLKAKYRCVIQGRTDL